MGIVTNLAYSEPVNIQPLHPLCERLIADGTLTFADADAAAQRARRRNVPLETVLTTECSLSEHTICDTLAQITQARVIDPTLLPADPRLVAQYGARKAVQNQLMPWRRCGDVTVILCTSADAFARHSDALTAYFGQVRMALTTQRQLTQALCSMRDPLLIHSAEHQVPRAASSRDWDMRRARHISLMGLAILFTLVLWVPGPIVGLLCLGMGALVALTSALKLAATIAGWRYSRPQPNHNAAQLARLPVITILVPLYKETDIAAHLIKRLTALDYPHALLDVCLILEEDDTTTRAALDQAQLPTWIRPIIVPDGLLKTKPRALNYAMTFARGSIIGVYDAEDAPATDQLHVVANHFANCGQDVACLQGTLDYYNPTTNWLTRCFTLEYASWFRVVLPGFARLGLVVPLGGTTLFFRREILEKLGGWDAHNVTEDADLGLRLARRGYCTEFMASVTEEEANGRMWPWIKQRSRWLKGYAITYAVHMRNPLALIQDLGAWRFFGVQVLFLGTLLQFALVPLMWSFWLIPLGLPHPVQSIAPDWVGWVFAITFFATALINIAINSIGVTRAGKPRLAPWALTLQFYFPLGLIAVYKGLVELATRPFYWDKTTHGVLMPEPATLPPLLLTHPVLAGRQMPR